MGEIIAVGVDVWRIVPQKMWRCECAAAVNFSRAEFLTGFLTSVQAIVKKGRRNLYFGNNERHQKDRD